MCLRVLVSGGGLVSSKYNIDDSSVTCSSSQKAKRLTARVSGDATQLFTLMICRELYPKSLMANTEN